MDYAPSNVQLLYEITLNLATVLRHFEFKCISTHFNIRSQVMVRTAKFIQPPFVTSSACVAVSFFSSCFLDVFTLSYTCTHDLYIPFVTTHLLHFLYVL